MLSKTDAREAIAALAPAARAFERAKVKGYVWIGEQGSLLTHESEIAFTPPPPIHPDQLRLA
jgi:hypothetical protein